MQTEPHQHLHSCSHTDINAGVALTFTDHQNRLAKFGPILEIVIAGVAGVSRNNAAG